MVSEAEFMSESANWDQGKHKRKHSQEIPEENSIHRTTVVYKGDENQ